MLTTISDSDGAALDAKVEVEDGAIIVHSRGGAFGKPNLRNPDHRKALRAIIERLGANDVTPSGVWLDSRVAQSWPDADRRLLDAAELDLPIDQVVTLIGQRGAGKGREDGAAGHGNSTKRVRIGVPGASIEQLAILLGAATPASNLRLPAKTLRLVEPWMIDEAIDAFIAGADHNFHGSRDYDLLLSSGDRLPPKAIFGIALGRVIGRPARPTDFSAGSGQPCFDIIQDAGYEIVPKGEALPTQPSPDADDERTWAEGSIKRVQHLYRERAAGLARTKKRRFVEQHGYLFCERCGLIPSQSLGPFGDSCIEVHHRTVSIAQMNGPVRTRLSDLQCLCANCHRIAHREEL
jgi:5-methylcytosine-specific restriction protein A